MLYNDLAPVIALDGEWEFALGVDAPWRIITVPGCWEAQGYTKWADGPACYRRTAFIPDDWRGQPILLEFDAVSYACTVRCNGLTVGQHCGMWTPFAVDITTAAQPGRPNLIEVEVYKPGDQPASRYPLRTTLAGFLPDVATTFGGLWQAVRLRAVTAGFHALRIDGDPHTGDVHIQGQISGATDQQPLSLQISITQLAAQQNDQLITSYQLQCSPDDTIDANLRIANPNLWRPEQPVRYKVRLRLVHGEQALAETTQTFGFRQLTNAGEQLLLNGQPISLRGALSWGWNPAVIAPFYTAEQVRDEIRRVRALGFNLIKLCLFIPNQIYYDIADEEGILLWQEWPMWLPEVTDELRALAPLEYAEYMQQVRHHPSVVLYSVGCEMDQTVDQPLLGQLNTIVRSAINHVLICDNSGSGEAYGGLAVDFADFTDYHTYGDLHFLEPTLDHWRRDWQTPRPWIFGEFCDSDGFRDLGEIIAANGGKKPWWMTTDIWTHTWRPEVRALLEQDERMAQANVGFTAPELVQIAANQSLTVRKYTLETVRKRSAVQGYVITGLRDTPIATSGIFDDLDRAKWPAESFRPFNDAAILCLDTGRSRRWQHGGDRPERLDIYNWWAGEQVRLHLILNAPTSEPNRLSQLTWQVRDQTGAVIAKGEQSFSPSLLTNRPIETGAIEFMLPAWREPQTFWLQVNWANGAQQATNQWPLWAYPRPTHQVADVMRYDPAGALAEEWSAIGFAQVDSLPSDAAVVITSVLDATINSYLQAGGSVLLIQQRAGPLPSRRGPFWREALKLLTPHPLWEQFPHQGFTDLQFFGLATDLMFDSARLADALPGLTHFTPILRRLDAREFTLTDYLFEARVGAGRLLGCTLRLQGGLGAQPTGFKRNIAGQALLMLLIDNLRRTPSLSGAA
ncbi:MAG: hypothetical protein NT075_15630 [Chloroflexi bacterium]|nr:hypothetical protein [Chloroflexota bacterium]